MHMIYSYKSHSGPKNGPSITLFYPLSGGDHLWVAKEGLISVTVSTQYI